MDDETIRLIGFIVISAIGLVVAFFARQSEFISNELFLTILFAILGAWGIGLSFKTGEKYAMHKMSKP